jgi:uncharacterized coiled-coil protein SlyX
MNDITTGTINDYASSESNHPVLQQLKDRIAELETQLETNKATAKALDVERVQSINRWRDAKFAFEEKVKNVLVSAIEDYDEETIKHVAEQLDVSLMVTKKFEVNVTFTVDIECEIGEEIDPDWDIDFTASHSEMIDYSSDVIWSKEIS